MNKAWVGQTGSLAGDWNVGANWNPAGAPMPGDVVYTGGNSEGRTITLAGTAANVATVYGGAALVINGTTLQITGGPDVSQLVKADVINGGAVSVTGATELFLGALTPGENMGTPSSGSLTLSAAGIELSGFVTEGASAVGSVKTTPTGSVTVPEFNVLSVQSRFENDGALQTDVLSELAPSPGSPASDGTFTATAAGTFSFRPGPGSTFTLSSASQVTGAGAVELSPLLAGAGTVQVADGATFTPGSLRVSGAERLDLDADAQVAKLQVMASAGSGGRQGDGLLIVTGPATSVLSGGMLGEGTTRFDGPLLLEVASDSARLTGGALVRTNGATEVREGGLDLTAGTWENAGALTITNASPKTTAVSGPRRPRAPPTSSACPPPRRCVSRRKFRIRLWVPAGVGVTSATVSVNGHRVKVVRGRRLRAPVDLRRVPRGRFKVAITVRLADGRSLRGTRRYRTCARGRHPHR